MAVYITGDTHGDGSVAKLAPGNFDAAGMTRGDCVIVLGDFGFPWNAPEDGRDAWWLDWYQARPWTTLFVDGNHDNFGALASYPAEGRFGGTVRRLRENVFHLMRGQVYEIDGRTFFCMGGARSVDRAWRTEGADWWPEEVPDAGERARAQGKIAAVGGVDYVLTHCPPANELRALGAEAGFGAEPDEYAEWLQAEVAGKLEFRRWFYGHMHVDLPAREPFTPLYHGVFDLDAGTCKGAYDPYPAGGNPIGVRADEYARFLGCPVEDVERAAYVGLDGSTMGVDADFEPLMYRHDLRRVLRSMGARPPEGWDRGKPRETYGPAARVSDDDGRNL